MEHPRMAAWSIPTLSMTAKTSTAQCSIVGGSDEGDLGQAGSPLNSLRRRGSQVSNGGPIEMPLARNQGATRRATSRLIGC